MTKNKVISKIFGIALVFVMVGSMLGGIIGTAAAAKFSIGDTVKVTDNLNVRTSPGTSYPEITDPDYPGYAPAGTIGEILGGPSSADGYIWWEVDYGPGLYSGWSVEDWLEKVTPCPHSCWDRSPLSGNELAALVRNHFPLGGVTQTGESIRVTAYAIAKAESGGNPSACGAAGEIGLWQIYPDAHPEYDQCRLFEEDYNANAAEEISNNGKDWNPWCTWEETACGGNGNEAYKQYLTEARKHFYPKVTSLSVSQASINLGEALKIYYSVSDDVGLDRVELWRTTDKNGSPDDSNWGKVKQVSISGTTYSDYFTDAATSPGIYWYGIHVVDNSGAPEAWNDEQNSRTGGLPGDFGPIQVEIIQGNSPPQLSNGYVAPSSGTPSTDFYYYVTYFDPDGDSPSVKQVIIDGTAYTMSSYLYEDSRIIYRYGPKNLSAGGTHYYFFYFEDGRGGWDRLPSGVDMYLGPSVTPETYPPQVTTEGASSITTSSATLTGNLDNTGGETCQVWFEYGTTTSYGSSTTKLSMSLTGPFSAIISTLSDDTTYHFRACASNSKGTRYGSDKTFTTGTGEVVTFPDPNLEAAIRDAIGKPTGDIYQSDLEGLTTFHAHDGGISNLTGLEWCINLQGLYLEWNQISDISTLSSLINLTSLYLYENQISDLTPISNLARLVELSLKDNQINDIQPLANLTNLAYLVLWGNQLSHLQPLANLTNLTGLDLCVNQISDISPLANLTNLQSLNLGRNQVSDLQPLFNLTNLTRLWLYSNQISDISPASNLTSLTSLYLHDNQISDIKPLVDNSGLAAADQVNLRSNPLSAISINTYIPQLEARGVTVYYDAPVTRTWYVDDDLVDCPAPDFTTIQEAVDAASSGDTIIVYPGTYIENIDVNKAHLTIESENGADSTIVQAANSDDCAFKVTADYAKISGFTVRGASVGIFLSWANHCDVSHNTALSNWNGINLYGSSSNTLAHNSVFLNDCYGIAISYSSNNTLTCNIMSDNPYNFGIGTCRDLSDFIHNIDTTNRVNGKPIQYLIHENNLVIDSSWELGYLGLVNCTNVTVKDLTLDNNGGGVLLAYSNNSKIENVTASNNYNGITLSYSSNNTLLSNTVASNEWGGIGFVCSSNNTLAHNTISNNYCGMTNHRSSENNIYLNDFTYNNIGVLLCELPNIWNSPEEITYTYNGSTYTDYLGNYWSDYSGSDIDGDGIGDTPYSIDSDADNYPLAEPFENYEIGPANQPPLASFTYSPESPVSSGDFVWFNASDSKDPEGGELTYGWDFGDGETATGCYASHRFRGAMNESRAYSVTLTVEDNRGATSTDSCDIAVTPLQKVVEVTHEPAIPLPGQPVFARMTVSYNWIHDDTYVVSRIDYESGGFIGVGTISIWDFHSHEIPMPRWAADIFSFGSEREETYSPILEEIHYGGDTFQGIEVDAYDAMNVYITGWAGISISIGPLLPAPFFETNSACFQPDYTEAPDVSIEAPSFDLAQLCSPSELRVYDPEGRVTGLVNGEIKEEIPYSAYNDNMLMILSPTGSCRYEIVGTDEGSYGLGVTSVEEGETGIFTATNIPTSANATHGYTLNWSALAQGEEGVTLQIDGDGDGIFEQTITSDATLEPPIAEPNGPYEGNEGSPIILNASGSYDPDGNITLYEWDFDDDGIYETNSTSSNITHTWGDDYNGTVTLRVTDDEGLTNTDSAEVTVNNVPPTVEAGPNITAECCVDEISLNASFTDPGWLDAHTATIDWDDGTVEPGTVNEIEGTVSGSHTYTGCGSFTLTLNVTDDDGGIGVDAATVTVVDTTPPEVKIEVPMEHAALQDGVTLTATASDFCGVAETYFYVRELNGTGIPIGYEDLMATLNPSTGKWECLFDTTLLPDGYYVVLAKAVDNYSNEGWSEVVPFSIRNWAVLELLPASESNKGGRTMPVKFSLRIAESVDPAQPFVYNEELEIRMYDQMKPGTILQTSLYGDTSRDYRIDSVGEKYITNFKTKKQPAMYTVEIWRTSKNFLIGSFTFETVK